MPTRTSSSGPSSPPGSLVQAGDRTGLTTRFVTGGGIDLRGPEVATQTLRVLAPLQLGDPIIDLERDPGEGLGLVIVVTSKRSAAAWRRAEQLIDPTLTRVGVFTAEADPGRLSVDATSIENFQHGWGKLAGATGAERPRPPPRRHGAGRRRTGSRSGSRSRVAEGGCVSSTELRPLDRDVAATLALAAYSIVVGFGLARVFGSWDFADDMIAIVVVGHGASLALRRWRVSGWVAVPAVVLLLVWLIALQSYRSTFNAVFPTGATWDLFRLETDLVREQFRTAVAPVLYGAGWATLSGLAIMSVVVLSDTFAFRAEARGEALVPGGVLYIFIAALGTDRSAALGTDRSRVILTAALIATAFVAVFALRALHDRRRRVESSASVRGARALVYPAAIATAVAIGVLAGVIGPRLPGANAEPLFHTRGRSGGVTEVLSPLVDIRSRLVNRTNTLLFRVSSPVESNWRYISVAAVRRSHVPVAAERRPRGGRWVARHRAPGSRDVHPRDPDPVARRPARARRSRPDRAPSPSDSLRYNPDTSTLLKLGDELGLGEQFTIESASPRPASPTSCVPPRTRRRPTRSTSSSPTTSPARSATWRAR